MVWRKNVSGHLYRGYILQPSSFPSTETIRLLWLPFFFLQTLLPHELKEAHKISIPFLCWNSEKCHCNCVSVDNFFFLHTVVEMKQVEFFVVWLWPIKFPLFYLDQFPLCSCIFFIFWVFKSNIYFCNTKEQFGCPIIQLFFPWPPFPPSDSYPADRVCTKTHAHPFSDWLAVTARRFALPRYGTQRHKASEAGSTAGLIILLTLCTDRPSTCSTRFSAAFYLTYHFVHPIRQSLYLYSLSCV